MPLLDPLLRSPYRIANFTAAQHDHGDADDGGQLDWDIVWSDAVHSHGTDAEGGLLAWNTVWLDAVHDHSTNAEGGLLDWDTVWADAIHDHSAVAEGGKLDWDFVWNDPVHDHSSIAEGGQLDWDSAFVDAVHSHLTAAEGGTLSGDAITTVITGTGNVVKATAPTVTSLVVASGGVVVSSGVVFIGDTANAEMSVGLTIRTSGPTELIALKHTEVVHGMTDDAESDTFFTARINNELAGGVTLTGYTESTAGPFYIIGASGGNVSFAKDTTGVGNITLGGAKQSGATLGAMSAGANVLTIRNHTTALFHFDASGDLYFTTAATRIVPGATSLALRNNANTADNLLLTDAGAATIRAGLTVTAGDVTLTGGNVHVNQAFPRVTFSESDWTVNARRWDWVASGGNYYGRILSDADAQQALWITVTRSGATVTDVTLHQGLTVSAGAVTMSAASALVLPTTAGVVVTTDGAMVWDTTNNLAYIGRGGGLWSTMVDLDSTQTLVNKSLTAPTIGDLTNANHTHAGTASGGQLDWDTAFVDALHDHADAANGGKLDWDNIWNDAVHDHSSLAEGGQLDWDTAFVDAAHTHQSAAEGGTLDGSAITTTITGTGNVVKATAPTVTSLVVSSGGVAVTGNSSVTGTLTATEVIGTQDGGALTADGPAGTYRQVRFRTSGSTRWQIGANNDAESGGNAGSTYAIHAWSDAQTYLGEALRITRATRAVTISTGLTVTAGGITVSSGTSALQAITGTALTISTDTGIRVESGTPTWIMKETDAAADEKVWRYAAGGGSLFFQTLTDVEGGFNAWMQVNRSGATASAVIITPPLWVSSTLIMTASESRIIPGVTSFAVRNTANDQNNLLISNAGVATVRAGLVVSAGTVDLTAATVSIDDLTNVQHTHANVVGGGQLVWSNVWSDAVHDHSSNAEGGTLSASAITNRTRNFYVSLVAGDTTPVDDGLYGVSVMKLGDAATERVSATAPLPKDYVAGTQLTIRFRWWMETATSGNVRLQSAAYSVRAGEAPGVTGYDTSAAQTWAVPGTADQVTEYAMSTTTAPTAGDWIAVFFHRLGADGSDTATGDLNLVAMAEIEYTADS